jgi:hypothetical protein
VEGNSTKAANETREAALNRDGNVLDAGWKIGLAATVDWIDRCAPSLRRRYSPSSSRR